MNPTVDERWVYWKRFSLYMGVGETCELLFFPFLSQIILSEGNHNCFQFELVKLMMKENQ